MHDWKDNWFIQSVGNFDKILLIKNLENSQEYSLLYKVTYQEKYWFPTNTLRNSRK